MVTGVVERCREKEASLELAVFEAAKATGRRRNLGDSLTKVMVWECRLWDGKVPNIR